MKAAQRKNLKRQLQILYEAPAPKGREDFLRELGGAQLSMGEFLWIQAGYIHKGVLGASAGLFFLLLYLMDAARMDARALWAVAACVPFLSMLAVAEGSRSRRWGMEELEMAVPFSLGTVWIAKMGILGFFNLAVLLLGAPAVWGLGRQTAVQTGVFLLVPFLLSAFLNLLIQRKLWGREAMYVSAGATFLVSGLFLLAGMRNLSPWRIVSALPWELLLPGLIFLVGKECYRMAKQTEEYVWNLS